MIIEDEQDSYGARNDHVYDQTNSTALVNYRHGPINEFAMMLEINTAIHDRSMHHRLKADRAHMAKIWKYTRSGYRLVCLRIIYARV
jgi:hypothetical protein